MLLFLPNISEGGKDRYQDIISKLLEKRIILLYGPITEQLSTIICSQLILLDSMAKKDISVYINSPGGNVYSGFAICDTLKSCKNKVKTLCLGNAFSAASLVLSCGKERYATKHSRIMIHQSRYSGARGGVQDDFETSYKELKFVNEIATKFYLENSNGKLQKEKLEEMLKIDSFLRPEEDIEIGLLDAII